MDMATTTDHKEPAMTTTTDIIFHGEPGWRFAFVEDFTIREVEDGFDIFQDCEGDDVRIACTDTLDEAILYVQTTIATTF